MSLSRLDCNPMKPRVVVTGLGCVTPLGAGVAPVWRRLLHGQSGVDRITTFDASSFPVRIAAEVRDWDLNELGPEFQPWRNEPRQSRFAIGAAVHAARDAGLPDDPAEPSRVAVMLGCGEVFPDFADFSSAIDRALVEDRFDLAKFMCAYRCATSPTAELSYDPGAAVAHLAGVLGAQGPSLNFTNACVSSSAAIGEALHVIQRGDADIVFAGGAHSMIHPFGISGFHRLSTLSTRNDDPQAASRPFDRDRDGFVVGEGAAIVVLEELEHARQRGANILAEVTGYGSSHDAYRITDPRPDARGAARCIQMTLQDAGLNADDIDYINAHGSSTAINDHVETVAIKQVFGSRAHRIPVSSTKSMTGHLTTACGALEFLFCILVLRDNAVPPTINYETPDPDCDLDYVPNEARDVVCRHVMSNSFGFGGQNVALIASRFEDRRA
jgi:3-oxoacyl-[acyl-carrier-protein] synthase II